MLALGRLASILLRAIMPKSCSPFHTQNLANIIRNRPNLVRKLGLCQRNFDLPKIDKILNSQQKMWNLLREQCWYISFPLKLINTVATAPLSLLHVGILHFPTPVVSAPSSNSGHRQCSSVLHPTNLLVSKSSTMLKLQDSIFLHSICLMFSSSPKLRLEIVGTIHLFHTLYSSHWTHECMLLEFGDYTDRSGRALQLRYCTSPQSVPQVCC